MNLPNNTLLQEGKYRIIRFISSGGFGCTYEAELVLLHKRVAIKEFFVKDFCNRDKSNSHVTIATQSKVKLINKLKKKFIEEANALFSMQHPNIIHVTDMFEENDTAYYVMDYINGKSLLEIVKKKGKLDESLAVYYIKQIAEALKYVHNLNRLHLDIKPGNIMINENNQAILIDFGASKQYDEVDGENTSTLLGKTPGYAPIEQTSNNAKNFTPATDIYALGATFYKILTGITPPDATEIFNGKTIKLPNYISKNVKIAINKSLELRIKNRPQTITDFMLLLDGIEKEENSNINIEEKTLIDSPNILINEHGIKPEKSNAITKIITLSIILLIITSIIYYQYENTDKSNVEEVPVIIDDSAVVDSISIVEEIPTNSVDIFETKSLKENDLNINIQWPTSLIGVKHINHLQKLISKRIFNVESLDINYLISNYKRQYDPNTEEILDFSMVQKINNIIIFKLYRYIDLKSGTGAGISINTAYLYYDTKSEDFLDIDKIIINKNSTMNAINKHISLDEYANKADFIPDNIILSMDGLTFVFPKYSIGYGYQGEVKIMVPYEDLVGCLSTDFLKAIGRQ